MFQGNFTCFLSGPPNRQKRINLYRDGRLRKMADTLSCVRLVKLYAWEDAVTEAVYRHRVKENYFIFLTNLLDGLIDSLQNSSTTAVSLQFLSNSTFRVFTRLRYTLARERLNGKIANNFGFLGILIMCRNYATILAYRNKFAVSYSLIHSKHRQGVPSNFQRFSVTNQP